MSLGQTDPIAAADHRRWPAPGPAAGHQRPDAPRRANSSKRTSSARPPASSAQIAKDLDELMSILVQPPRAGAGPAGQAAARGRTRADSNCATDRPACASEFATRGQAQTRPPSASSELERLAREQKQLQEEAAAAGAAVGAPAGRAGRPQHGRGRGQDGPAPAKHRAAGRCRAAAEQQAETAEKRSGRSPAAIGRAPPAGRRGSGPRATGQAGGLAQEPARAPEEADRGNRSGWKTCGRPRAGSPARKLGTVNDLARQQKIAARRNVAAGREAVAGRSDPPGAGRRGAADGPSGRAARTAARPAVRRRRPRRRPGCDWRNC